MNQLGVKVNIRFWWRAEFESHAYPLPSFVAFYQSGIFLNMRPSGENTHNRFDDDEM